jgi:hypothetical protein
MEAPPSLQVALQFAAALHPPPQLPPQGRQALLLHPAVRQRLRQRVEELAGGGAFGGRGPALA